jgi:hypothetical protein
LQLPFELLRDMTRFTDDIVQSRIERALPCNDLPSLAMMELDSVENQFSVYAQ